jgi:hypothetical protein
VDTSLKEQAKAMVKKLLAGQRPRLTTSLWSSAGVRTFQRRLLKRASRFTACCKKPGGKWRDTTFGNRRSN